MAHRALNAFPKMLNPSYPKVYMCALSHVLGSVIFYFQVFFAAFPLAPRTSGQVEWTEVTAEQLPQLTRRVGRG